MEAILATLIVPRVAGGICLEKKGEETESPLDRKEDETGSLLPEIPLKHKVRVNSSSSDKFRKSLTCGGSCDILRQTRTFQRLRSYFRWAKSSRCTDDRPIGERLMKEMFS